MRYLLILFFFGWFYSCTMHTKDGASHGWTNDLAGESSPYLLQHAHNPVHWQPWGPKALERAKKENKMLLISIGYAACHWCHVMEKESFEDTTVARMMNVHFVCIKVDREERPDVDAVYMAACQLASGGGCGWPLNAFALPDGRPVWAGTYFPRKKWLEVLDYFIKVKKEESDKLEIYAAQLLQGVQRLDSVVLNNHPQTFDLHPLNGLVRQLLREADSLHGGTRVAAPKFPMPSVWSFLLEWSYYQKDETALQQVCLTLDKMASGGIYDQIGGGFARYATDEIWKVPHFEKMLYDNAQLVSLYSKAFQVTQKPDYRRVVEETLDFLREEMTSPDGGFYSSFDADSDGEEGKYYVWKLKEIQKAISDSLGFSLLREHFQLEENGNWEKGKNILWSKNTREDFLAKKGGDSEKIFYSALASLKMDRNRRSRPALDDKILTSWNGLMIRGYCDAYRALGREVYKNAAIHAGNFLVSMVLQKDGRLNRNYKDGKSVINGFLDDYAHTILAFADLYQITFDEQWLDRAALLCQYTIRHFRDSSSGLFYYTSDIDPALVVRKMEKEDNVIVSSNTSMAEALEILGIYLDQSEWREMAAKMLHQMLPEIKAHNQLAYASGWASLWLRLSVAPYEVAVVGKESLKLAIQLQNHYLPFVQFCGGTKEGNLSLLQNKLVEGETRIYVCQNRVCKWPVKDVVQAMRLLQVQ